MTTSVVTRTRRLIAVMLIIPCLSLGIAVLVSPRPVDPATVVVAHATEVHQVTPATVLAEINAVRAKFHLAPGVRTSAFARRVASAARSLKDPLLVALGPSTVEEDGIWGGISTTGAAASLTSQQIVDAWVYEDGWEGAHSPNLDCTSPTAPGCDGHRRAVLRAPPVARAVLSIDIFVLRRPIDGAPGLSIAAILCWTR